MKLAPTTLALSLTVAGAAFSVFLPPAAAQENRPDPVVPTRSDTPLAAPVSAQNGDGAAQSTGPRNRPATDDRPVQLGFNDVGVEETFGFIATGTGKVVMPVNLTSVRNKRVTLLTEAPVSRARALDLLFQAFRINGVGVIELPEIIIVGLIDDLAQIKQAEVIDADGDIMARLDKGNFVVKMYRIRNVPADAIAQHLQEGLPPYATVTVDLNSNQIIVFGDIALCQHFNTIITNLDASYLKPETRTFRLRYADAQEIANQVLDLYESSGTGARPAAAQRPAQARAPARPGQAAQPQQPRVPGQTIGPEMELRVTVSPHINSLTIVGEPAVVREVGRLIQYEWDLPRAPGTSRIFTLKYTDPVKVADKLNSLLGQSSGTIGGRTAGAGARAGGGGTTVDQVLSGIYRLESYPDTNQILVFAKTEESLDFLASVIQSLDRPTTIGLPFVVELKHANAVELAEQLNALLAEAGAGMSIRAPDEGLSGPSIDGGAAAGGAAGQSSTQQLQFPWQRGGQRANEQSPESPLIGRVRIVPIIRQNALAILCPRPQEESVRELIEFFDRPGRQVMISVILAELVLQDNFALGLRLSSNNSIASSATPDNLFSSSVGIQGSQTDSSTLSRLFDTSVIDTNISLTAVIQALKQENNARIIQQPVVFTADNREAYFFDGQDIPFISQTTINSQGQPTDSFEYREVGVLLNARPRITRTRDIDLELKLELSATVPGQTLFGGAIIDKRVTTTRVIIKNGQTIVLSGILKESETKVRRKVPFLGDIPILGELFTSREDQLRTSELIAFITPIVVDNPEENDVNFQESWRSRLDDLIRPLDEQFREYRRDPARYRRQMERDSELREQLQRLEEMEEQSRRGMPSSAPADTIFEEIIDAPPPR